MLNCLLFFGMDGFAELRDAWEMLSALAPGRFFSEWTYWDALLHSFERDPKRFVFAMIRDGSPLAIIPLRIERQSFRGLPLRVLTLPNYHHPSLSEMVCRLDAPAPAVHAALLKGLRGVRWDMLDLDRVMGDSIDARDRRYDAGGAGGHLRPDARRSALGTGAGGAVDELPREREQEPGPSPRNCLPRSVSPPSPAETEALFERFLQLEDAGWKGKNGTSILREPHSLEYYRRILRDYGAKGRIRINWLKVGDEFIAMQLCVVGGDTLYMLKIAYDETMGRLSPGNALHGEVLRTRAYRWINVVGNPAWFQPWKPESLPVMRMRVANHTPSGLLAMAALRGVRVARRLRPHGGPESGIARRRLDLSPGRCGESAVRWKGSSAG